MSGSHLVTAQRPTSPTGKTVAPPIRTRSPIHRSSWCGPTPSISNSMRNLRPSTGRCSPASRPSRASDARETSDIHPAFLPRSAAPLSDQSSVSEAPTNSESAAAQGPSTAREGCASPHIETSTGSPGSTTPSATSPSGNRSASRRLDSSHSGRTCISCGNDLPLTNRPAASSSQNRRSPSTPVGPSSTSSGWTRPSALTGAIEMRTTDAAIAGR